eukprot:8189438-Pyramimonas_sp.AAC.1
MGIDPAPQGYGMVQGQCARVSLLRAFGELHSGAKVSLQGHTPLYLGCNFPPTNYVSFGHIRVPAR